MIFKLPPVFTNTCQTRSLEKRVIAIWVKREGRWQGVSAQITRVPETEIK